MIDGGGVQTSVNIWGYTLQEFLTIMFPEDKTKKQQQQEQQTRDYKAWTPKHPNEEVPF